MANCANTSVGFPPLTDGAGEHQGLPLGLYSGGSNNVPSAHLSAALALAAEVVPRRPNGNPNPNGNTGLVSIGPSNTSQEMLAFMATNPSPNPKLILVDGAQGQQTAHKWSNPASACWTVLNERINAAGLTNAQVQVAWVKMLNYPRGLAWPAEKDLLQAHLDATLRTLAITFPNLKIAYLSSWVYGGYSTSGDGVSGEPNAYESAFAVRGVIETQLAGLLPYSGPERVSPLLLWGPYLWADGIVPRADGLTWVCSDYEEDGQHPGPAGEAKAVEMLRAFFTTDVTTVPWFTGS
jgi:hypothetical protein